jgi:thiosulfate/3-mercaptopyruvate sulfurtransferase
MLESLGFSRASVLDGGFEKWSAEGRAIERGSPRGYPSGDFTAASRSGFFVDEHAVLAARNDPRAVVINALGPQSHKGLEQSRYGRPGRIPGSINVPAATLYHPATKIFASPADAERQFAAA